jgi:signal transduction histidine kinase
MQRLHKVEGSMRVKPSMANAMLIYGSIGALSASMALHALRPDWRWHQEPLHSTMEAVGGLASVAMAIVLFQRRNDARRPIFRALAVGFLGMGILELFHAVVEPGNSFVLLRNMASLVGGIGFSAAWLSVVGRQERAVVGWLPWMLTTGAVAFGLWALRFPEQVPEMIRNGEFTPTAVAPQSLACLLFFVSAVRFLSDYHRGGRSEDYLFASLALLFGSAELVFMYSLPWDSRWWFWHGLRLTACLLVLAYVGRGYLRVVAELQQALAQTTLTNETLQHNEQQLRRLLDDRERMAQDLHDSTIQSLFAIGLGLERCQRLMPTETKEVRRQLGSAITRLKHAIRDLRGYLVGLESPVADGQGFESALASLVAGMDPSGQLRVVLDVDAKAAERITEEWAPQLLSIVREAMSNSLRHADAHAETITLRFHEGSVRLMIEDDGIGFNPETVGAEGHGLRNMGARTRKLGGRLDVFSEPGRGTRVVCDLPQEPLHAEI